MKRHRRDRKRTVRRELRLDELQGIVDRAKAGPLCEADHAALVQALQTLAFLTEELQAMETITQFRGSASALSAAVFRRKAPISLPLRRVVDRAQRGRETAEMHDRFHLKNALAADRLSCGAFKANFLRLLLHAAAYRLMHAVRAAAAVVVPEFGRVQFDTLRLRLLKVAAHVTQSVRRILVRLPRVFRFAAAFRALSGHLARPAPA